MTARTQTGVALISVLLVFAIITILASQLITRTQMDIERTRWLVTEAQAYQYALGGEAIARQLIYTGQETLKAEGHDVSFVPKKLPAFQPDHGKIAVEIIDEQGLLNINNINGNTEHRQILSRFFANILQKPELSSYLSDWVDTDSSPQPGGAEDFSYFSHEPPYRTANRPVSELSELMALPEVVNKDYEAASSLLSALPEATSININTAPEGVLSTIHPELSGSQIVNYREQYPPGFTSVESFLASDITAGLSIENAPITVKSAYFSAKVRANVNDRVIWLHSRFIFDHESMSIKLISRSLTPYFSIDIIESTDLTDAADSLESTNNQDKNLANTHL